MSQNITVTNLQVKFPLFDRASRSVRGQIGSSKRIRHFTALDGINVEINQGERVGLLGKNGAGKSTFLRTLAGVYKPTMGTLEMTGQCNSLFDIAVGFDLDATGYDNIPLLMVSRGIPLKQLDDITRNVEEFTELGEALDRPVRTYSQGMRLRLAFAVSTARATDILLMDEVIGVGDANFREKSSLRINQMIKDSGILILASHSAAYLKSYCTRGLIFEGGKIIFDGDISDAINYDARDK